MNFLKCKKVSFYIHNPHPPFFIIFVSIRFFLFSFLFFLNQNLYIWHTRTKFFFLNLFFLFIQEQTSIHIYKLQIDNIYVCLHYLLKDKEGLNWISVFKSSLSSYYNLLELTTSFMLDKGSRYIIILHLPAVFKIHWAKRK